jgi:hypothetical protein
MAQNGAEGCLRQCEQRGCYGKIRVSFGYFKSIFLLNLMGGRKWGILSVPLELVLILIG